MMFFRTVILFVMFFSAAYAAGQTFQLDSISELGSQLRESSGLLYRQDRLISHNDSGDEPLLYELDTITGDVIRQVWVNNASHVDWEDITADDTHLYIADIGNNFGTRTDLVIYRIPWIEYWTMDTVTAQRIDFAYEDQVDFSSNQFFTPFDAESLQHWSDSLYIFTKDWSSNHTRIYRLPREPGQYSARLVDSLIVPGLVTAIDAHPSENKLLLTAYDGVRAYLLQLSDFIGNRFSSGELIVWDLPLSANFKTEAVCWRNGRWAYLTTEAANEYPPALYRLDTDFTLNTSSAPPIRIRLYPQPTSDALYLDADVPLAMELFSLTGQLLLRSTESRLLLGKLPDGPYVLQLLAKGQVVYTKMVVKN